MRLRRLVVRGFGQLRGSFELDGASGGVGLLLADNESGKSTLAAAIRAALYGLETDRRRSRGRLSEVERFRPWEGGPYGVRLHLEDAGREFVLERDFDSGAVRVFSGAEDRTQSFQSEGQIQVGQALTGLTRRQFELSCFVGQGDVVLGDATDLAEALQRSAASEAGGSTAARALALLEEALSQYDGWTLKGRGKVETEIRRCEDGIVLAEAQLAQLDRERDELAAKLDLLLADGERRESFEQQRDLLRARRLRAEVAATEHEQHEQREQMQRIETLRLQVAAEHDLRSWTTERVARLQGLHRVWSQDLRAAGEAAAAAAAAERRRRELQTKLQALQLSRRPTGADRDGLLVGMQRLEDARLRQSELDVESAGEMQALRARGFEPEAAEALVSRFESLSVQDRERIATRGQFELLFTQQKHELEERIGGLKRRRAEIRHAQQTRKHFGIWCLVVGMLPIMLAITMFPHLPFSPWILHGVGLALLLGGIAGLVSGQQWGRREDVDLRQQLQRQRELLQELAQQVSEAEQNWQELARRVGSQPEEIQTQYGDWQLVQRSVDTLRRLHERREQVQQQGAESLAALSSLAELFGRELAVEELPSWRDTLGRALDLERELQAADLLARDAQRKAEETAAQAGQREQELRSELANTALAGGSAAELLAFLETLPSRAEAAHAARERAQQLPLWQERLTQTAPPSALADRVAVLRAELGSCEGRLRVRSARGPQYAFAPEQLAAELSAEEFEREWTRLDESERGARSLDEADRHAAQHFLLRYEREAPALREQIELHRAALQRAQAFADAIRLAHATLERVARETHHDWSTALNVELRQVLRGLGSEVEEAMLDEKLRLRLSRSGKLLAGEEAVQQLSVGAVERVYLALRIALARALTRDGHHLPLILDDPFANADDARLILGLNWLTEAIAPTQQVLLLACQNSRYGWAQQRIAQPQRLHRLSVAAPPEAGQLGGAA